MASAASANPDALVTLKVSYDGTTRKCKLPLRDMGASSLENKLRAFLAIPAGTDCLFERYSDSASSFVVLDPNNVSVYKQLYRAAKAKSKLKLRVTAKEQPKDEEDVGGHKPQPVSVEDEPESRTCASTKAVEEALKQCAEVPSPKASPLAHLGSLEGLRTQPPAERSPVASTCLAQDVCSRAAEACPAAGGQYAVCCNSCDKTIPDAHYHCATCDDGDFDLCQACVDRGITCYSLEHWLIKRSTKNGQIVCSVTETLAPKKKAEQKTEAPKPAPAAERIVPVLSHVPYRNIRTCNSCVRDYAEATFVHCVNCEDYDLCKDCFAKDNHGHHPKHAFVPAVEGSYFPENVNVKLSPGRNQLHNAICDGCDKFIIGVRHKCLDCPDWDFCADCMANARFIHSNHRFVPIYEPLPEVPSTASRPMHYGICCDGPLCSEQHRSAAYITGTRYKCAVCHDTDFCASCEASPSNTHNKTHPLIKFKTPVRHVSVTTNGEKEDGQRMPLMGDRLRPSVSSRATETLSQRMSMNKVRTVVDVKPTVVSPTVRDPMSLRTIVDSTPAPAPAAAAAAAPQPLPKPADPELSARYVKDLVEDGTILPPNHIFEQTWVLRNDGEGAWPAGCAVRFVGGDYMGSVDSKHPAGISELVSASESTVCYEGLAPGEEFPFTVLLRTPAREGKILSYWRLTTPEGVKFGDRLWCEVVVAAPRKVEEPVVEQVKVEPKAEESVAEESVAEESVAESTSDETAAEVKMEKDNSIIFPRLEKESPAISVHEDAKSETPAETPSAESARAFDEDDFEECSVDEWGASDDGFLTDEEYDILDASDEEYLLEEQKKRSKN